MIQFEKVHPEDISFIVNVSEQSFKNMQLSPPEGFDDYEWFFQRLNSGFLFKILFNGAVVGGFLVFKIGIHNYQLDRLFIVPEYQNNGLGKKAVDFLCKRFPEAKVWFVDVNPAREKYVYFLSKCGFFESSCKEKDSIRYIKLAK